jgi:hypothetical protein
MSDMKSDLQSITTWARATLANASAKIDAEARKIGNYSEQEYAALKLKLQKGEDLTEAEAEKLKAMGQKLVTSIGTEAKQKLSSGWDAIRGEFGKLVARI